MKLEPLKAYDWTLKTGDVILDSCVLKIDRPIYSREATVVHAVFREMTDVDVLGSLLAWQDSSTRLIEIHLLSEKGDVIEVITGSNVEMYSVRSRDLCLDYGTNDIMYLDVILRGKFERRRT